ncbi:hypothetical protein FHT78_001108 [Rhizobium sp. BK196]|uniref:hypothetical protein n=1 Tax=unclassified Rhizobium TaxID=2613769 RepID=UPI00162057B2|nr:MULTISPECIES: hypothetical protein [unclassified Rhizobium]MBB3309379.1 hypothetical protein [Rhizobium sp. BK196]MBB3462271.1 hypothetical protein [Rhizobium sp. BK377]
MQLIDPNHPTYRHLWVRIAIVAVCLGWAIFEFIGGDPFWGVLAGAVGVYSFYMLIWTFDPKPPEAAAPVVVDDDEEGEEKADMEEEKKPD